MDKKSDDAPKHHTSDSNYILNYCNKVFEAARMRHKMAKQFTN